MDGTVRADVTQLERVARRFEAQRQTRQPVRRPVPRAAALSDEGMRLCGSWAGGPAGHLEPSLSGLPGGGGRGSGAADAALFGGGPSGGSGGGSALGRGSGGRGRGARCTTVLPSDHIAPVQQIYR